MSRFLSFVLAIVAVFLSAIEATKTFKIQAHYPKSLTSLSLRGNGCGLNWNSGVRMSLLSGTSYTWETAVTCDDSTNLEVKVLVNDRDWMLGSNHHINVATVSSVDNMYPWFYTYQGTLTVVKNVFSKELNNFRDVIFYLPPSYNENTLKSYDNVLIMHDGQNLFNPSTSAFGTAWMCQDTLNGMIINGQSDEVLVAGAYNTADRMNEYTYIYDPSENGGGKGDLYLDWIESTLIPLTSSKFRVNISRDKLGILGSSLGGLISCYAGWTRPQVYGKVGCMSSSFWWDDNDFQKNVITKSVPNKPSLPKIYMDAGTGSTGEAKCALYTSQIYDYAIQNCSYVGNQNIFKYVDEGAQHNEASWGKRFNVPIGDLFPSITV